MINLRNHLHNTKGCLQLLDERAFVRPDEFLPQRWMTQPELVKDASVFIPFNAGMFDGLMIFIETIAFRALLLCDTNAYT